MKALHHSARVALVGILGLALALAGPLGANAASGIPDPINVLPSVVKGGTTFGPGSLAFQTYMAKFLGQFAVTAKQQAALEAATPTPAQLETITGLKAGFKMPGFKMGSLVKGAGAVGIALLVKDLAVGVGQGTLEALGIDVEGNVCGAGGPWAALASVDCTDWKMTQDAMEHANDDVSAGLYGAWVCSAADPTICIKFLGYGTRWGTSTNQYDPTCWAVKGVAGTKHYSYINNVGATSYSSSVPYSPTRCGMFTAPDGGTLMQLADVSYKYGGVLLEQQVTTYGTGGYGSGAPETEVTTLPADPERVLRCKVTLSNSTVLTKDTAPFHESDGATPAVDCPNEFPPELSVSHVSVWLVGGGVETEVWSQDPTPEYSAAQSAYPECMGGTCLLDLRTVSPDASCFANADACADWFADPDKATNFQCKYGTHVVALTECNVYAPTFKPGAKVGGAPYGDPTTGEPLPGSGPGSQTGAQLDNPQQNMECFPTGWSVFNPVEWVMKPVQCAWAWAAIPSPTHLAEVKADIGEKFAASPPGKISAAINAALAGVVFPTGCEGVTVSLAWMKQGAFVDAPFPASFNMLAACPGDVMQPWAVFCSLVVSGGMIFVAFKTLPALIGRIFTYSGIDG